jgi:DNA-binding response OmpR family regulator
MPGSQPAPLPRVLLADSDYRTSSRLAQLLREDGFEVDVVRDGAAAIARLSRAPFPDTLITELKMRFADGVSVARYALTQRPGLQVVVLTGHPHLLAPGAIGSLAPLVLTKPLDYALLLAALTGAHSRSAVTAPSTAGPQAEKC